MGFWGSKKQVKEPVEHHIDDAQKKENALIEQMDAPWIRAQQAYDDTFLRLAAHATNWRRFAMMVAMIATIAVGGVAYIGAQSKFIPFLIEVDKLSRTVAVRALDGSDAIKDPSRLVYREMVDLMSSCRTVTTDISANNKNIHQCLVRLKGAARNYAITELRKAPPNEVGATKTIQIDVKSAQLVSDSTWQIEWVEHSYSLAGVETKLETWKAMVKYELKPSSEEKDIRENPIGFSVTDLNWLRVIE
jgi:type IV secretion system protein VirB5